jgi:AcrR family transcriptional regulator
MGRTTRKSAGRALRRGEVPGLTRQDWAEAGLQVIHARGLGGLTIDAVAAHLGVTKGSFYWHFENRAAFLEAALEWWEVLSVDQVAQALAQLPGPRERLAALLQRVVVTPEPVGLDSALLAGRSEPLVAAAWERATARRLAVLEGLYRELGLATHEAAQWALQAYSAFAGLLTLSGHVPGPLRTDAARRAYAKTLVQTLVPPSGQRARG